MLKRFELPDPPPPRAEPLQFEIAGRRVSKRAEDGSVVEGDPFVERFTVVDYMPFASLDDVAMSMSVEDGQVSYDKAAVLRFMRRAVAPDDRMRWAALMNDPERLVDATHVVDIMLYIVAETSDRPTGPRSSSPNGSQPTGDGSAADSPSPDTTDEPSPVGDSGSGSTSPS